MIVAEAGMLGASDQDHLAFARKEGRVIFTQDDDFLRLHAGGVDHAGNRLYAPEEIYQRNHLRIDAHLPNFGCRGYGRSSGVFVISQFQQPVEILQTG